MEKTPTNELLTENIEMNCKTNINNILDENVIKTEAKQNCANSLSTEEADSLKENDKNSSTSSS